MDDKVSETPDIEAGRSVAWLQRFSCEPSLSEVERDSLIVAAGVLAARAADLRASQAKLAAMIGFGKSCAVWIAGLPEDAEDVQDFDTALGAIKEAVRLGQERNDEANALRVKLAALTAPGEYDELLKRARMILQPPEEVIEIDEDGAVHAPSIRAELATAIEQLQARVRELESAVSLREDEADGMALLRDDERTC